MDFLSQKQLELKAKGCLYLRVKVHPGAKVEGLNSILSDGTIKIDIRAAAEGGRANKSLLKFLATTFQVRPEQISILSGAAERIKLIKIII